jgi:hypothetical protein
MTRFISIIGEFSSVLFVTIVIVSLSVLHHIIEATEHAVAAIYYTCEGFLDRHIVWVSCILFIKKSPEK